MFQSSTQLVSSFRHRAASVWALFARASVAALEPYYGNRLVVHLQPATPEDVVVPKLRVTELRKWVSGG